MYLIKNASRNIIRSKGRNILIGIVITVITISSCIALSIYTSGNRLIEETINENPISVQFNVNMSIFRENRENTSTTIIPLTKDEIIQYGTSSYVKNYYYTGEASLSSSQITPVSYTEYFDVKSEISISGNEEHKSEKISMGDYRFVGYSDPSYIESFVNGTNKIIEGTMFEANTIEPTIIISEELASKNSLKVGDTIIFYLGSDTDTTYSFSIIGIYEDNNDIEGNNSMGISLMNSGNQIYTNITQLEYLLEKSNNQMSGLTPTYYLNNKDDIESFETEVREKGLNQNYKISTNEEEVLSTLTPIMNIRKFSITFLIVILIVGSIILSIINLIQIRERKYEIGVLRAIGMSKCKVTIQLVLEVIVVAFISLVIGTGIGIALTQPVTNTLLKSQLESTTENQKEIEENFGGKGFNRPIVMNQLNQDNYVKELYVNIEIQTLIWLFLIGMFLVTMSSVVSILFVNHYEPNQILQNRS